MDQSRVIRHQKLLIGMIKPLKLNEKMIRCSAFFNPRYISMNKAVNTLEKNPRFSAEKNAFFSIHEFFFIKIVYNAVFSL